MKDEGGRMNPRQSRRRRFRLGFILHPSALILLIVAGCASRLPTRAEVAASDARSSIRNVVAPDGQMLAEWAGDRLVMLVDGPHWRVFRDDATGGLGFFTPGDAASVGVVVSKDGYVLTSAHGVSGGRVLAILPGWGDDSPMLPRDARVVWTGDDEVDVALLKIDLLPNDPPLPHLPPSQFARSVGRGEEVLMVGIAPDVAVNGGPPPRVSAAGKVLDDRPDRRRFARVRVDAPVRPGFSGGPGLDSAGRLAGITARLYITPVLATLVPFPQFRPSFTTDLYRPDAELIEHLIARDQ